MPGQTGSQTVGPFYAIGLSQPAWNDLTAHRPAGEVVRIEGRLLDGDGQGVPDGMLEIWQANAAGKYAHPDDTQAKPVDPNFAGFGRANTGYDGTFTFTTIVPGGVPGAAGDVQAPHINVSVFARGLLKRLVTRIYFSDHASENAADPLLRSLPDDATRATLVAERAGPEVYTIDIVLQGDRETAFFDL